ncbi:dihydrolipoamide acetyltransferase family protein [Caldalkalibacillus salinus]|uniref:dihydrolipoamide acetyltransferase family protein n=1 Tax=Caldalkalibacillus salinus TaxID=2803787 RepID=UPI0019217E19|nr:dihydrolipoamide acetyltransferase family protein [Caldalkalibacillus salinus]
MYEMKLHDIGEGMTEGEVVQHLVQVGDDVEVDQPVMEVQTDKVCAELPSPVAGKVSEITVQVGDIVSVGSTILVIDEAAAGSQQPEQNTADSPHHIAQDDQDSHSNHQPPGDAALNSQERLRNVMAAPYTRKVARDYGIQIEQIKGTGPKGRITLTDVERHAHASDSSHLEVASAQEAVSLPLNDGAQVGNNQNPSPDHTVGETVQSVPSEGKVIPFKGRRKQIANKMTQSMFTIPHVTHFDKIDMTHLLKIKQEFEAQATTQTTHNLIEEDVKPTKISIMAFVLKAIAVSLQQHTIFNAKLNEDKEEIYLEPHVNLGVAVDSEEGLIVPVIPEVESKSILEINALMKQLTKKAQQNELSPQELKGGTFTVSNVGPIGSMFATPIINHPEVGLLAFHQMEDMPVVRNNEIVIRSILNFSMSFDHRVADGVAAVQFTNQIKHLLENPMQLFVHLK